MATATFVHDGDTIDYTPSIDIAAGEVVVLNDLIGVAKRPIAAGTLGSLAVTGVFDFPKLEGSDEALEVGETVSWNPAMSVMTASSAGVGHVVQAAGEFDATVRVRLSQ